MHERHIQCSNLSTRHHRLSIQRCKQNVMPYITNQSGPSSSGFELNCTNTLVTCGAVNSKITSKCSHSQSKTVQLSSPPRHNRTLSVRCHRTSSSGIKRYLLYAMACDITHIYHNHSSFTDLMLVRCSRFLHMLSMLLVFWWRTVKAKIRASQWSWTPIQQAIPHELHYIMEEKKWHANAACLIDVQHRTGRSDVLRVKSQKERVTAT